ncbi:MAG: hypothetical protein FWC27_01830, partial [Firmicutes bacterium]|nr:hypothetical protein [Bacillota bacterium]
MPGKRNKGPLVLLLLIIAAAVGLYFAHRNNDIAKLPAATTGSTLAELWETNWAGHRNPPASNQDRQPVTSAQTARDGRTAAEQGTTTTAIVTNPASNYIYAKEYNLYPGEAAIPVNRYLICVNRSRALPAKYRVDLAVCVENVYPENRMMERQAAAQYRKMYDAARASDKNTELELIPFS